MAFNQRRKNKKVHKEEENVVVNTPEQSNDVDDIQTETYINEGGHVEPDNERE